MDDSERSYGYSEDIYHGPKRDEERSYEYGPEGGREDNVELSPEEAAIHVIGQSDEEPVPDPEAGHYDYGRESNYATAESFTWDLEPSQAAAPGDEERNERSEAPEEVSAGQGEPERR